MCRRRRRRVRRRVLSAILKYVTAALLTCWNEESGW
jgi:hypothetical protein